MPAAPPAAFHSAVAASLSLTVIIFRARARWAAGSPPRPRASSASRMPTLTRLASARGAPSPRVQVRPVRRSSTAAVTRVRRVRRYPRAIANGSSRLPWPA